MNVIIVGGTSGVGLALARYYLKNNNRVIICGRNIEKVPVDIQCHALTIERLDVTNSLALANFFESLTLCSIDLLIYCAGKYFNERRLVLTSDEQAEMIAVNKEGFLCCFDLAAKHMKKQHKGHLVTISSVAGVVKSNNSSLYSSLKCEMIERAKCYKTELAEYNVHVSVVAPGYINTEKLRQLNEGDASHKIFIIEENHAVKEIVSAINNKKTLVVFPLKMKLLVMLLNCLPAHWVNYLLEKRR